MPLTRAVLEVDSFQVSPAVQSEGSRIAHELEKLTRAVGRLEPRRSGLRFQVRGEQAETEMLS
jgi:hypothetical protein